MKAYLSHVFCIIAMCFNSVFAQSLDELHASLPTVRGWVKTINLNSQYHFDSNRFYRGEIIYNKNNREVVLLVFSKEASNDSLFHSGLEKYYSESSCSNYNSERPYMITSFSTKDFFVVPRLCPVCRFDTDKHCQRLENKIFHYIVDNSL